MAYRNNIIRKYYISVTNFVTDLWAELSAMGWTLEDNQDGSSYRVYSSGVNINGVKGYMKFSWTTSAFTCIPYTYWNSTSHTGYGAGYASPYNSLTFSESGTYIWIYGDGTFVALMSLIGTTYDRLIFGHLTPFINVCTYLTALANSGSNVQITVNSTSGFIAGKKYQIVDSTANGYRQWVTVNSIDDATHMTIATLSNNYPSGARIGTQPVIFGQTNGTLTNRFGYTCPFGTTGNGGAATGKDYYFTLTTLFTVSSDDAQAHQKRIVYPIYFYDTSCSGYYKRAFLAHDYIFYAWTTSNEDILYVNSNDSGTSSGSNSSTTLNDTTKNWTSNAFQNKAVIITGGTGAGQIRKIASNTSNQLTIATDWITIPDDTSTYRIVDEAYRALYNQGFACREGA